MAEQTVEQRVERIERLIEHAIEVGSKYPIGRVILAKLGLQ